MNMLPVSNVSNSVFTLGVEDDELQAEDSGISAAGVRQNQAREEKVDLKGTEPANGQPHEETVKEATMHALKAQGTGKQLNADTTSSAGLYTAPVQQHSDANRKTQAALGIAEEAAPQHNGQAVEHCSSANMSMAAPESKVNNKRDEDAAVSTTAPHRDEANDANVEQRPSSLQSAQEAQESAGAPGGTQPSQEQSVSAEAEEQRIADVSVQPHNGRVGK
jgi:hypothetical protein